VEKFTNAWPSAEVSRNLVERSDLLAEEDLSRSMRDLGQTKILPNTPLELLHSAIMVGCSCGSKYLKLKRHCIWSLHTLSSLLRPWGNAADSSMIVRVWKWWELPTHCSADSAHWVCTFFLLYLRIFVQQVVSIHALETRKFSLLPI
jgi:hypothetical protein